MKKALRTAIERYELPVRLTANQNLILTAIDPSWKADILATLTAAGVKCASPCIMALFVGPGPRSALWHELSLTSPQLPASNLSTIASILP